MEHTWGGKQNHGARLCEGGMDELVRDRQREGIKRRISDSGHRRWR